MVEFNFLPWEQDVNRQFRSERAGKEFVEAAWKCLPMKKALRTREHLILANTKEKETKTKSGMVKAKLNYRTVIYMRENIRTGSAMGKELTSKKTQYIKVPFTFSLQGKWQNFTIYPSKPKIFRTSLHLYLISSARRGSPKEGRRKCSRNS